MTVVTTAMYKTARGIGITSFDADIAAAISSAESMILSVTGRDLALAERTEYHEFPLGFPCWLQLNHHPVTNLASVAYWSDQWVTLDPSHYEQRSPSGKLFVRGVFSGGRSMDQSRTVLSPASQFVGRSSPESLRIVYTAGYTAGGLEKALLEPFYKIVDAIRYDRTRPQFASQDGFQGVQVVNRSAEDLQETIRQLCQPFKAVIL